MDGVMRIAMIGLDTSHCVAFAKLLHDADHPFHVPGARVVAGFPGGSEDFELSRSRVEGFKRRMESEFGIVVAASPEEAAEQADGILITAGDGRRHLELMEKVSSFGKPVFIDKPLAVTSTHAHAIFAIAERRGVPVMSSSALRYAAALEEALAELGDQPVSGADCYGPMDIEPTQGGLFWYGIHTVEMLYRIMGKGCVQVSATSNDRFDLVVGRWADGRIGTVRGTRAGSGHFGATIHGDRSEQQLRIDVHPKPFYAGLLENVIEFMRTGASPIDPEETLEIIRFIEAANESRAGGGAVSLNTPV